MSKTIQQGKINHAKVYVSRIVNSTLSVPYKRQQVLMSSNVFCGGFPITRKREVFLIQPAGTDRRTELGMEETYTTKGPETIFS